MKWWVWGFLVAVGVAVLLSPLASRWPDGLEKVAEGKGFLNDAEGHQVFEAPIPDYALRGTKNRALATAAAGLLGTTVAFGLAFGVGRLLARRRKTG